MVDDSIVEYHRKEIAAAALELGLMVTAAYRAGLRVKFTLSEDHAPGRPYPLPVVHFELDERPKG